MDKVYVFKEMNKGENKGRVRIRTLYKSGEAAYSSFNMVKVGDKWKVAKK